MLARGLDPTPESLARVAGISPQNAALLLTMDRVPELVSDIGKAAMGLQVRMLWLTTGETIPQITSTLSPDDAAVLAMSDALDTEKRRRWLSRGKRIALDP